MSQIRCKVASLNRAVMPRKVSLRRAKRPRKTKLARMVTVRTGRRLQRMPQKTRKVTLLLGTPTATAGKRKVMTKIPGALSKLIQSANLRMLLRPARRPKSHRKRRREMLMSLLRPWTPQRLELRQQRRPVLSASMLLTL